MVSVFMLSYNHEKYIAKALESVVTQKTNFRFEVIVHDDASTDRSAEIIREYEKRYPELIHAIYQTENQFSQGIGIYRKFIHPIMKGKYVAACECDDYWCDELKLQKQVDVLESHPEFVGCCHNCLIIDDDDNPKGHSYEVYHYCRTHIFDIKRFECGLFPGQTASKMYRMAVNIYSNQEEYRDMMAIRCQGDQKINLHLLLNGSFYYMEDVMSCHRVVSDKGTSWAARIHGKDMALYMFRASRDLRHYAKKYYNYTLHNHYVTFHRGLHIILRALKGKNPEAAADFKGMAEEIGSPVKAVLYVFWMGVRAFPFFLIQKLQKNRYDIKE